MLPQVSCGHSSSVAVRVAIVIIDRDEEEHIDAVLIIFVAFLLDNGVLEGFDFRVGRWPDQKGR
jgi:hypothetical protein